MEGTEFFRVSALWVGGDTVQVIFRNESREKIGKFMSRNVYDCFPLGMDVSLEMFETHTPQGYMLDAPDDFIKCFETL